MTTPESHIKSGMEVRLRRDIRVCFNITLHAGTLGRVSAVTADGKEALFAVAGMAGEGFTVPCENLEEIPGLYPDMAQFLGIVSMGYYEDHPNVFKGALEAAFRTRKVIPRDTLDMVYELSRLAAFDPQDPKPNYRVTCMAYHRELKKLNLPNYAPPVFPW